MNPARKVCVLAAVILAACVGTKVQRWQADEFVELQLDWHHYQWEDAPLAAGEKHQDGMLAVDHAVRQQVEVMLGERGYRQQGQAQFVVDYRVGDEAVAGGPPGPLSPLDHHERVLAGPNAEYEVSSRFYTHRTLGYHEVSHLKLTLYDVGSGRIVWESSASRLVDDPGASPDKVGTAIAQAVKKMLQDFPPAGRR